MADNNEIETPTTNVDEDKYKDKCDDSIDDDVEPAEPTPPEKTPDEQTTDEQTTDEQTTDEQTTDEQTTDKQRTVVQNPIEQKPSKQTRKPGGEKATSSKKKQRLQIDPNDSAKAPSRKCNYPSSLPPLPEESKEYKPVLYTFRVKTKPKINKLNNVISKSPPFYLLLDHTLAVLWTLFNKNTDKSILGIAQFHWALYFLQSLFNSEGDHPKDIQLAINTIQEYLLGLYNELSEESVIYGGEKFEGPVGPSDQSTEEPPFSVNYSQMLAKYPASAVEEAASDDDELKKEIEAVKKLVGIDSGELNNVASKDQIIDILADLQQEHLEKIANDVKMLHVVEDMMKNTDEKRFKGYTDISQFDTNKS